MWIDRKHSLNNLHIWGCSGEVKIYKPEIKKLIPGPRVVILSVIQINHWVTDSIVFLEVRKLLAQFKRSSLRMMVLVGVLRP